VTLEDARPLGQNGAHGFEGRVRLPDGTLEETILSPAEAAALAGTSQAAPSKLRPVDAAKVHLLAESARIRLASSYDRQFAVSLSGIRTLPHQIEAVYQAPEVYAHEMSDADHRRMLAALKGCWGKVILSGYANDLYDGELSGWPRHEVDVPNNAAGGKTKRRMTEVLWCNFW
jgi:hypothetical protein